MLPKSSTWQQNHLCSLTKTSWTDLVRKGLDFVARASLMFILVRREGLSYLTQLKKDAEKPTSVALCFCPRHEMLSSLFLWIYLNRRLCLWLKHLPLWPATSTWSYVNTGPVCFEKSIWSTVFFVNIIPSIQWESLCRVSQEGLLYILFCALQVKEKKKLFLSLIWLQCSVMCVKRDLFKKQLKYRDGNNLLLFVVGGYEW